jgi:hypothetical protein
MLAAWLVWFSKKKKERIFLQSHNTALSTKRENGKLAVEGRIRSGGSSSRREK